MMSYFSVTLNFVIVKLCVPSLVVLCSLKYNTTRLEYNFSNQVANCTPESSKACGIVASWNNEVVTVRTQIGGSVNFPSAS
jgi:hypothetical protein